MSTQTEKKYTYAVCPHCEHPNVHVHSGRIARHTVSITSDTLCLGTNMEPMETHLEPLNRHTQEFRNVLSLAKSVFNNGDEAPAKEKPRPAFVTWHFAGVQFIAVPFDNNSDHIMDATGANYGSWMSVEKFRKRQQSGVTENWSALGRAHLRVVCER